MTWEEQLQRTFETAASRLKEDVAREVRTVAFDVVAQVRHEREAAAAEASAAARAQEISSSGAAAAVDRSSAQCAEPSFAEGGTDGVAIPVAMGGEIVAVLYADQGPLGHGGHDEAKREGDHPWAVAIEILSRHAARCLEAWTAL